ncbi:F-box protein At1g10780 [Amborella trichopoda]|nr:F-box protein At1g10780 [Amborella trichopoda]|eukprot:XP_006845912.3 F-box protein At1g10780 [Amborella trichopoda]
MRHSRKQKKIEEVTEKGSETEEMEMDDLPDAILQYILSFISHAKDVASCSCVSNRWKEAMPYIRSLYFPRNSFDERTNSADSILTQMITSTTSLERLVVYCPFSVSSLSSWLSRVHQSLKHLELRLDSLNEKKPMNENRTKLDCIGCATRLETLKLWGVLLVHSPKWFMFKNLHTLEMIGVRLRDNALAEALRACPNLTHLSLLGCDGTKVVSIDLQKLEEFRLDFYGLGDSFLSLDTPKLRLLEVQGACWIRVNQNSSLKYLSIANNAGKVAKVNFGKLEALEYLSIRGVQWGWDAVTSILQSATEVKHLVMKIEFSGDSETLQPFPEIDFVEFFSKHPKLCNFECHGAMFAALCQKNSLKRINSKFMIPSLEQVLVTVRSPLNAEQKLTTLESLVKYSKRLRRMVIRVSQMKNCHECADDFFEDICRLKLRNSNIIRIE